MKFLSLFSGLEAASVAWKPLGWECVGVSEIEPFPCFLLYQHYGYGRPRYMPQPSDIVIPEDADEDEIEKLIKLEKQLVANIKAVNGIGVDGRLNLGDISKITEQDIKNLGQIDLVVFGSPCQDLSVAGKRKGLKGARSGLFTAAIRIIRWARNYCGCRFALWENVPGAFSSNKGADFAKVVEQMAGLRDVNIPKYGWGKEGAALGDNGLLEWCILDAQWFGLAQRRKRVFAIADFGDWQSRPPILLERESLRGDTPPNRKAQKSAPNNAKNCTTISCEQVSKCLTAHGQRIDAESETFVGLFTPASYGQYKLGIGTLRASGGDLGGGSETLVVCHGAQDPISNTTTANALGRNNGLENCIAIAGNIIGRSDKSGGNGNGFDTTGACYTLTTAEKHAVAVSGSIVRRLTPLECERLQGFPDNYTRIPYRNKLEVECPDGPRYKALGNSMAVPVMRWIGEQIQLATNYDKEALVMMTQSPSSLQLFDTCPRQYEARYITKEVKFQETDHTKFGNLLHKAIEDYLLNAVPLPTMLTAIKPTLDRMGQVLVGAETKLAIDKNSKPVEFFDKAAYQRCIVDAILTNNDKSVVICIDWKTGKKRDAQIQHDMIKKCVLAKYPKAKVVITLFIYLFVGESDRQECQQGSGFVTIDRKMNAVASAYASGNFSPTPNGLCKEWCDVVSCEHNGKSKG